MTRTSTRHSDGAPWAFAALLLLAGCGQSASAPPAAAGTLLEQLGVSTNATPRSDSQTIHPLGKARFAFQKRSELFVSGATTVNSSYFTYPAEYLGKREIVLDGDDADGHRELYFAPLFTSGDDAWTRYNSASVAADLSGSGRQEVVVLYHDPSVNKAYLRTIGRGASGSLEQSSEYTIPGSYPVQLSLPNKRFDHLQLAAGDVDGDGRDEVVAAIGGQLVLLEFDAGTVKVLATVQYRSGKAGQVTTVAVGDLDGDRNAEIVVVNGVYNTTDIAWYYVYGYASGALNVKAQSFLDECVRVGLADTCTHGPAPADTQRFYVDANVAIGDVDGDGLNEVVFAGDLLNGKLAVAVARWSSSARFFEIQARARFDMDWAVQDMPFLAIMDLDGPAAGRQKEILVYRYILRLDPSGNLGHYWEDRPLVITTPYYDKLAVGDFDGDGRDEIALVTADGWLDVASWTKGTGTVSPPWAAFNVRTRVDITPEAHHTVLCAADVDGDSTVVKYSGEYELLYSNPQVIAVLASPPYYQGQEIRDANTELTVEWSTETVSGVTKGFHAGVSLGCSAEAPFWGSAGSAKLVATVDETLDISFTKGSSSSAAKTFTCPAGENQVIFASTPFDVYYYEVVDSPDTTKVGQRISVQVPREPVILPIELSLYNSTVPADDRIPTDVLKHHFGDPWSYPTRADMQLLFKDDAAIVTDPTVGSYQKVIPVSVQGGFRTPDPFMIDVGRAGGSQKIELTNGASKGYGDDFNLQVGVESESVVAGVLFGGRLGFNYGYSHSYTTSNKTVIAGRIPNLPPDMATKAGYSAGLFAYPYPATGAARFVVVNYWVEKK